MARIRVSTTVDQELLAAARLVNGGSTDASLLDEALSAYLQTHRSAEIDARYKEAYVAHPLEEPDDWGDITTWLDRAAHAAP